MIPALALLLAASAAWAADGAKLYKSDCAGCHGMHGEKKQGEAELRGQSSDQIQKKLQGYIDGSFGGSKKVVMINISKKHEADLKAISDYASTLE